MQKASKKEDAVLTRNKPMNRGKPMKRGKGFHRTKSGLPGKQRAGIGVTRAAKAAKAGRKAKKPTTSQLKKRVWKEFSILIRTRDADEQGYVQCVTCEARHLWNSGDIHAGHWMHGRLDFDERNIHPQCKICNYYSSTKVSAAYSVFMARTYGAEVMDELRLLGNSQGNRYSRMEIEELFLKYKNLNKANPLVLKDKTR